MSDKDKYKQELFKTLTEAFTEAGSNVHIVDLSEPLDLTGVDVGSQDGAEEFIKFFEEMCGVGESKGVDSNCNANNTSVDRTPPTPTKSTFAAYSYDKATPVPLPASILTEAQAVQYMEKQGYKHFEVYRKLGTYKAETKTEMVRQ